MAVVGIEGDNVFGAVVIGVLVVGSRVVGASSQVACVVVVDVHGARV